MKRFLVTALLGLALCGVARAAIDTYEFASDAERERFRNLTQELRCPKCQNQDIADSNAPIAADLRKQIYGQLQQGKSDGEIVDYMVARYGDFVRYKPPVNERTWLLWFGPGALLLFGVLVIGVIVLRRRRTAAKVRSRLGRAIPLVAALLVPLVALGLYLHWGASDKVELAREFAQAPHSMEEMTARLERAVQAQPDSAQGWYFLGRTYMTQERGADAARAFERAAELSGRQPEVLGQWAQALYFSGGKKMTAQIKALADEALKGDPAEVTTLGLLGIAAFEEQRYADAIGFWERLVSVLPNEDPARSAIQGGIQRARERMTEAGQTPPAPAAPAAAGVTLTVKVDISDAVKGQVKADDSVFVFARAVGGPPMPLAVKRLTVADLPAEVSLSDADAMMPQLKLSGFPQVELVARVSRAGNAISGEWIGRGKPLSTAQSSAQALTIDGPDQPQAARP